MLKKACIALMIVLMAVSAASARVVEGVDMPETLQVGDEILVLNGAGVRVVVYVLKMYVGGLYLKSAETDANKIMMANETMSVRLHIISDTGRNTMMNALRKAIRNSLDAIGGDFEMIRMRFETFQEFFPEETFPVGSIVEFSYVPAEGMKIYKNGSFIGTIEGIDWKQAFFGIWLNEPSPADTGLKASMIAGDVSREALDVQGQWLAKVKLEKDRIAAAIDAKSKAKAEAEEKAKAEAEEKAKAEAEAKKLAAAPPVPAASKPVPAPAKVAAPVSVASMPPSAANNALVAALLVNAIKTSEQIALQQGKSFNMDAETRRILDLWSVINAEVSR